MTEGQRRVLEAMAEYRGDPFYGTVERRILDEDLDASDMEIPAAQAAIENAGIDPACIDLVLQDIERLREHQRRLRHLRSRCELATHDPRPG